MTYFEGSSAVGGPAMGVTQDQNLVGQALRTVWPDEKLEMAVYKILNPDRVSLLPCAGERGAGTDQVGNRDRCKSSRSSIRELSQMVIVIDIG